MGNPLPSPDDTEDKLQCHVCLTDHKLFNDQLKLACGLQFIYLTCISCSCCELLAASETIFLRGIFDDNDDDDDDDKN